MSKVLSFLTFEEQTDEIRLVSRQFKEISQRHVIDKVLRKGVAYGDTWDFDWAYRHFPDPEHGEWYGYLHRDGRISVRLKGNLWKGPFHLPRMQLMGWRILEEMLQEKSGD